MTTERQAPGGPGSPAVWTTSSKTAVGTAANSESHVWFTISHGILNEIYYPLIQTPSTRDLQFLVTDGRDFFSEEKRDTEHRIEWTTDGIPAFRLTNTCKQGRYRIQKTILADPNRDVVMQRVKFTALRGSTDDYRVYVLLAPHLAGQGGDNTGWVGRDQQRRMLFAERDGAALAVTSSIPFGPMTCGFVGVNDPWRDIRDHKKLTLGYTKAAGGNIALAAQIDLTGNAKFVLAVGFGKTAKEAARQANDAVQTSFDQIRKRYEDGWSKFQSRLKIPKKATGKSAAVFRSSLAVLKTHQAKTYAGGAIASLSVPWGTIKGDESRRGYHVVWTRDLVECAGGLLAAGDVDSVGLAVQFLSKTQQTDGHWPQNMWLNGDPYETQIQMDETAFPILLADMLRRHGIAIGRETWPMVRKAAAFLLRKGPVTAEERWESKRGYSPSTLAVEISALLAAADFADDLDESASAKYLRETADVWNQSIERWTYVVNTDLSRQYNVEGYYVQVTPPHVACATSVHRGGLPHENASFVEVVSPDALTLVRFGLRAAHDQRIRNTIKVVDATLRAETLTGPVWHRFTRDTYGEHEDGSPFDRKGKGRGWPLLTGERAHYELAAGNETEARRLLHVIEAQTSSANMIPEQVWDGRDIPERGLHNGHPSSSACPLAWAHAEYVKLVRSLSDGEVFDCPSQTASRYLKKNIRTPLALWRFDHQAKTMTAGENLRLELLAPATIRWSADDWRTTCNIDTRDSKLGLYTADLAVGNLKPGAIVRFTFRWGNNRWEGTDFEIKIEPESS